MKIYDMIRASDTKRWNTVRMVQNQSVAEHSYNVAIIAMRLVELIGRMEISFAVATCALLHDIDEVITGDIPGPTKHRMDENTQLELGKRAAEEIAKYGLNTDEVLSIVKVAERLEEAWYIRENSVGTHAVQVQLDIIDRLQEDMEENETAVWLAAKKVWEELCYGHRSW